MNSTGDRAILVGPSYIGLATLAPSAGAIQVLTWPAAPDGRALPRSTETMPAEAFAVRKPAFNPALSPYSFGIQHYDPFQSLAASLDRAAEQGPGLSLAVWAALEADLFRFAFDHSFTAALDDARGTGEWLRFARLNGMYRACVMALAPLGMVPPAWNAWLRDDGKYRFPLRGYGRILERLLTRPIVAMSEAARRSADPG